MYEFSDADYDLLAEIAITTDRAKKTRLIRALCKGKPIPTPPKGLSKQRGTLGYSPHNAQIQWLDNNFPGWNDPIPDNEQY